MFPLFLLLVVAQLPAVPGEGTLLSHCKQGLASACEALKQVNPQRAAEIIRALETLKTAEEAGEQPATDAIEAAAEAAPEPPDCKGQNHHVISRPIAERLDRHETLQGLYKPRDRRFVVKAKDEESHCGYQEWHRKVDREVIDWLDDHAKATAEQFVKFLREIYNRPDMRKRFPHGF